VGATVARRYRLVSQAGSGGMAEVWRAVDTRLDRTVAVKLLLPELAGSAQARERAVTEARAAARINHPNVAAVYDAGHRPRGLRRPVPYLVMEYVDGETLDRRLAGPASLDWRYAARIAAQVADGLAAAHLHRVVHRDIKPGNVILTTSGVKVVDFGLAAIVDAVPSGPIRVLLGTPEYMAPEQLRGEPVTLAVDLYALGLMLHHMLTGCLPWTEATRHALTRRYVGHRASSTFSADLTVTGGTGQAWTVRFTAPPGQRVTSGPDAAWSQAGSVVTVTGQPPADDAAPWRIDLAGVIDRPDTGFPTRFELNGSPCQRAVSIYTIATADG
jgi:serine/threonine protein kinase